jgi:two-component system, NarL family, nitrate/nitrite response regulator NarL
MRCLIVDDQAPFLKAAKAVLERDGVDVVGLAATVDDALHLAAELTPDVALVDIDLAQYSGFDLAAELAARADRPDIVLISTHGEGDFAELIADSPAIGFLPKTRLSARSLLELVAKSGAH